VFGQEIDGRRAAGIGFAWAAVPRKHPDLALPAGGHSTPVARAAWFAVKGVSEFPYCLIADMLLRWRQP
jgi:hypothetical protein